MRVTFVDGFCGGGSYSDKGQILAGTPLLLLDVVQQAMVVLNRDRQKQLAIEAQFHFVDVDKAALNSLKEKLATDGHLPRFGTDIHLRQSTFARAYPAIKSEILSRTSRGVGRSVFVLDQKGYTDVPIGIIADILASFSGAEVILTLAVDWLINYLSDRPQGLNGVSALSVTNDQVRDYIKMKGEKGGRIAIQRHLLSHLKLHTGARYVSPFFIRSEEANKDLWIVHLSNHVTARNVMVASHWETKNHSWHPGRGGLEILGFDPKLDPDTTPDFWFQVAEHAAMQDRLAQDVMRRIADSHPASGVRYIEFVSSVANETPARLADFDAATERLIREGELQVRTEDGFLRRASRPRKSDLILPNPQLSFRRRLGM